MKKLILTLLMLICWVFYIIPQTNNFKKRNLEIVHNSINKSFLREIGNIFEVVMYNSDIVDTIKLELIKIEGIDLNNKFYVITNKNIINESIQYNRLIFKEINTNIEIVTILNIGNKDFYELNDFSRILIRNGNCQQLFLTTYDYKANVLYCGKTLKFNLN